MKNDKIALICELCPRETGVVLKLGDLRAKIPALREDPEDKQYRNGLCPTCQAELESGCTFFCDDLGRVIKVSAEATREKISDIYWGKVVRLPRSAFEELMAVYMEDQKSKG